MKSKLIILGILCIFLISPFASACSYHLPAGDDAVDWAKCIQWGGSTRYSSQWNSSVSTWNAMGVVKISKDTILTSEDLYILDVNSPGVTMPAGYANSTVSRNTSYVPSTNPFIQFNIAVMGTYSSAEKQKTITHELGHALGINDNLQVSGNVMKQGRSSQTYLGTQDKEIYNCIWR